MQIGLLASLRPAASPLHPRRTVLAACIVAARDLSRQLLQQLHPKPRIRLECAAQGLHWKQQNRPAALGAKRVRVPPVAQNSSQFQKLAGSRHSQRKPRLQPLGTAQILPGNHDVESTAILRLAKHNLPRTHIDAPGRTVQQRLCPGRALQQLRQRTSTRRSRSLGSCLRLHVSISLLSQASLSPSA